MTRQHTSNIFESETVQNVGANKVLTIPNAITLVRLCALPFYVIAMQNDNRRVFSAILLAAIASTDWLDGYIARRYHQISTVGKIIDPVADRILFFVGVGMIYIVDVAPRWFCLLIIIREIFVSTSVLVLAMLGAKRIDVTWLGKLATAILMVTFPLFILSSASFSGSNIVQYVAYVFASVGGILSWYSAGLYIPLGIRALREGRMEAS